MNIPENRTAVRQGFTLIELVMVMLILVALAGLIVPMIGNLNESAHGSSGASNITAVARNLQFHRTNFGGYPNELDLLLNDHNDDTTLAPLGGTVAVTELTTAVTTDRIADALEEAGIEQLIENPEVLEEEEDQTVFGAAGDAANDGSRVVDVDAGALTPANVVVLGADAIARLGLEPIGGEGPEQYVVLGVGNNNDAIGRSMIDAPIHFSADEGNQENYSRLLAVFRIPAGEGGAILASVVAPDVHDGEVEVAGVGQHIQEFYEVREQ